MSTCGSNPLAGGRRRRSTKKSRKMKGGNFYGVGAAIAPGVLERTAVPNLSANSETGQLGPADTGAMNGGRRHRRSRKHSKKSLYADIFKGGRKRRTTRRRKLYGGANQMLPGNSSAGFTGEGSRGLANYVDVGSARHNNVVPLK
jgi:hypothetical protein